MRAIDPIDRIALMEKLGIGKECTVCEQNSDPYCKWKPDVVDVCEAICTAPTIEPERKKGHWVGAREYCNHLNDEAKREGRTEKYMPSEMVIGVYCDQCWAINTKRGNYCSNCGARMEGES